MLRLVVPRGKRFFSGVLILCADGEVEGPRGEELQHEQTFKEKREITIQVGVKCVYEQDSYVYCNVRISIFTTLLHKKYKLMIVY